MPGSRATGRTPQVTRSHLQVARPALLVLGGGDGLRGCPLSQPRSPVERDSGHSIYNSPRTPPGRKNECSFQRWPVPTPRAQAGPCFITSRASRGALCVRACFYAKGMPFRGATAVPKGPHPGASACRLPGNLCVSFTERVKSVACSTVRPPRTLTTASD